MSLALLELLEADAVRLVELIEEGDGRRAGELARELVVGLGEIADAELHGEGHSLPMIAGAVGASYSTARRDRSTVSHETVERTTSFNGRELEELRALVYRAHEVAGDPLRPSQELLERVTAVVEWFVVDRPLARLEARRLARRRARTDELVRLLAATNLDCVRAAYAQLAALQGILANQRMSSPQTPAA